VGWAILAMLAMSFRLRTILLLSSLTTTAFCQAPRLGAWKIVGPGGGGTMIAPTISPVDPRMVVEHCDMTGGYVTYDHGESWRMFNLREGIGVFAFNPQDDHVLYAGNSALWRTADRGKTWQMVFPSPSRNTVEHQLGDHAELSLTSDDPSYPGGEITAIAIDPSQPQRIVTAWTSGTLLLSTDGGVSQKKLAPLPGRVSLLVIQENGLLAVSGSSVFRISFDGKAQEVGRIPGTLQSISSAQSHFYATNNAGELWISNDSGASWKNFTPALGQSAGRFEAVGASAQHPDVAYAGFRKLQLKPGKENLYNGIAKTTDGGNTWRIVFQESSQPASNLKATWLEQRASQFGEDIWFDSPVSLGVSPTDPDVVYATDLFRTYRSLDGGAQWEEVNSTHVAADRWVSRGLDVTTDYGVQFDPFDAQHIFIDYTDIGLFQSRDGGKSWISSSAGVPEAWRNTTYWLAFDPAVKGLLWGAFSGTHDLPRPKMFRKRSPLRYRGGVAVSHDGGLHWQPSGAGMPPTAVTHILMDPQSPVGRRTLYATAFGRGVYKSTDNGQTWLLKNEGITGQEPFAWRLTQAKDSTLYLVVARRSEKQDVSPERAGALYRSTDGAEHWQQLNLPPGVNGPTGVTLDPRNQQRMYLTAWGKEGATVDSGGGVYVSEDGGANWKTLFTASQHVYDLTVDPRNPDTLYIGGFDAAVFRSTDRGAHWEKLPGYNFKWGHRVVMDPNDASQIYVTTYGGGVWHGPAQGDHTHEDVTTPISVAQ
jgi:photosystem II stability/assembly factor-like uncharacterized protein